MNNKDNSNDHNNIGLSPSSPPPPSSIPQSLLRRLEGPSSNKAGLIRDPDQVARIIYQCSKGSKYFLNERAKDQRLTNQIERLRIKLDHQLNARNGNLAHEEHEAERLFENLDRTRVLNQSIVCIDADAFFCSVEELHDPSLKGKAFAVGSGVLTTASYEARKWGCRSAMAGYIATKLCPHLIFVEPDFTKYQAASKSIMDILRHYDPNLSPASLDECFLNITSYCREHNLSPNEATLRMREHVFNQTGLTVSAGIGPNVMIAKIAADLNKPNGQFESPSTREGAMNFMKDLPVRKVPGIGRVTERWLEVMGVVKCGDIWDQKAKLLLMRSEVGFELLIKAYLGLGETDIKPSQREDRQSVGCESSFKSICKHEEFSQKLEDLSQQLATDLSRLKFAGRTLTLKIKLDTFEVLTRSITPTHLGPKLLSMADDLYKQAKILLEREIDNRRSSFDRGKRVVGCGGARELSIRLLGIKISQLQDLGQPNHEPESSLHKWISNSIPTSSKLTEKANLVVDPVNDAEKWSCPICNRKMPTGDLTGLNEHVDLCLWQTSEEAKQDSKSIGREEEGVYHRPLGKAKRRKIESLDRVVTPITQDSRLTQPRRDPVVKPRVTSTNQNAKVQSILDWCGKERKGDQG